MTLQQKIDNGIKLIQAAGEMAASHGQPLEICYSGGKDSDVILELARMSGVNYKAIYKNTTIDPPGTERHAKDNGVEVRMPKMSFKQIVEKRGLPGRMRRMCCEILKEYKIMDYAVVGVRKDESKARAERYDEPEQCRVYPNKEKSRLYYPLLEWTATDVAAFVAARGIKCHPLYYDDQGRFHAERRLGCMGCPLVSTKKRIEEFKRYPGMVRLYVKAAQVFFDNHPDSKMREYINDACEWFVMSLYCNSKSDFEQRFGSNLFGRTDCKAFLEEQFKIKLF